MSKTTSSKKQAASVMPCLTTSGVLILLMACASSCSEQRQWIPIPAGTYRVGSPQRPDHPPRIVDIDGFSMQRTEVTVADYVRYLNDVSPQPSYASPQISFDRGRYRPQTDGRLPVAYVTYADAKGYAEWLTGRRRKLYRLPSATEWEIAASAGNAGRPFPWGWAPAQGRAQFDADGPRSVAQFAPNPLGLYDLAGNVAEWCIAEDATKETAPVMGGSWAERDSNLLRVFHRLQFPRGYRDADVGFRLVR